jgi:hypothetical protein
MQLSPIIIDIKGLREKRQEENIKKVFDALSTPGITEKQIIDISNGKELQRLLKYLKYSFDDLIRKCQDADFAKVVAHDISIEASRQGSNDESAVLKTCSTVSEQLGIQITNLPNTEARPTKDGRILSGAEYKKSGLKKNDCLKSFDAKISGRIAGWIFAKITILSGGHQDNVFEEAHCMGEWIIKYGKTEELYVLLIDTDLVAQFNELREKYHRNNVLVVNHVEFQQYLIDNHSKYNV